MKYILILLIRIYWFLIPAHTRKACLFRESCSKYVYRITNEKGFFAGLEAIRERFKICRAGYSLTSVGGMVILELCNGTQLHEADIASNLILSVKPIESN
jgi:hypothetical protein